MLLAIDQRWNVQSTTERLLCLEKLSLLERAEHRRQEEIEQAMVDAAAQESAREAAEDAARFETRREKTPEWEAMKTPINFPGTNVNFISETPKLDALQLMQTRSLFGQPG